jgi:hypothetical protein
MRSYIHHESAKITKEHEGENVLDKPVFFVRLRALGVFVVKAAVKADHS